MTVATGGMSGCQRLCTGVGCSQAGFATSTLHTWHAGCEGDGVNNQRAPRPARACRRTRIQAIGKPKCTIGIRQASPLAQSHAVLTRDRAWVDRDGRLACGSRRLGRHDPLALSCLGVYLEHPRQVIWDSWYKMTSDTPHPRQRSRDACRLALLGRDKLNSLPQQTFKSASSHGRAREAPIFLFLWEMALNRCIFTTLRPFVSPSFTIAWV